jgi:putative ABC transport system permease protein
VAGVLAVLTLRRGGYAPGVSLVLAVVLVALVILAVVAAVTGRLGVGRAVVTASARAVLQLGLVSLLIAAVLRA